MRYNLGLMDQYPIEAAGSTIENNPMYRVFFSQYIDPIRLEDAFYKAMKVYPLFSTRVRFDGAYYLEDNDQPLKIIKSKEEDRPLNFGRNTNGYPWQCCYFEKKLTFEWLHGVSDGVGAYQFLRQMLICYFGGDYEKASIRKLVAPGLEPFFDKNEKGIDFKEEPEGFSIKDFPVYQRGYKTDCYLLKTDTKQILDLAKSTKSSVAPILAVLFSRAIRNSLPEGIRKKDVACNVVLDLRRPLDYETMHNCVEYKRITYTDRRSAMSFTGAVQEYRQVLNHARKLPNVIRIITDRVKLFKAYHILPSRKWLKFCVKAVGLFLKDRDCNFVLTYPGRIDLPENVAEGIEDFDFRVWHDFGECILSAVDYNGNFNLNVSINFIKDGIVDEFIRLSNEVGIHWEIVEKGIYEQAHFEE